jgi:hypothetical protein
MLLSPDDAALFYRAWGALLTWVNDQRGIVPHFARPSAGRPIEPLLANQIRKVVWAEDALREQFLAEGAADLGGAERDLIASWEHRERGRFIVLRHLQKHSIFMSKHVYGVLGLFTPFAAMLPNVPMFVEATLLPFRDVIITDGIVESPPMQISFGGGARRVFEDQYRTARTSSQIRTSLPWRAELGSHDKASRPKPPRKPGGRRTS